MDDDIKRYKEIYECLKVRSLGYSSIQRSDQSVLPSYVTALCSIVESVFKYHIQARLSDESSVLHLSDGSTVTITAFEYSIPTARALKLTGDDSCICISTGLLRAIFECTAALYAEPTLVPWINDPFSSNQSNEYGGRPRGLEYILWQKDLELSVTTCEASEPEWLQETLTSFTRSQKRAFEASFRDAVLSIVFHELGHITLGHLGYIYENGADDQLDELYLDISDISRQRIKTSQLDRYAMEIQADRLASKAIFEMPLPALSEPIFSGIEPFVTYKLVGIFVPLIIFQAFNVFNSVHELSRSHPPIWCRGRDVYVTADRLYGLRHDGGIGPPPMSTLLAISRLHPVYAEWLSPIVYGSLDSVSEAFLTDVRAEFNKVAPMLEAYRASPVRRQPGAPIRAIDYPLK